MAFALVSPMSYGIISSVSVTMIYTTTIEIKADPNKLYRLLNRSPAIPTEKVNILSLTDGRDYMTSTIVK